MPIHEAEAIILRQYSLSDSDCIVVFITKEYGKVRAVAKGIKKPQSRLAGFLQPLNHIQIEFFSREGRELAHIRQAEMVHSYLAKNTSTENFYICSYFAELTNEVIQENNPSPLFFRLLLSSLKAVEINCPLPLLLRYFEIWCLKLSGLLPNYDYCSNCGKCVKDDGFFTWLETGQVYCNKCAGGRGLRIGAGASGALHAANDLSPEQFASKPFSEDVVLELERLTQKLLSIHLEKQLKSYRILREALHVR